MAVTTVALALLGCTGDPDPDPDPDQDERASTEPSKCTTCYSELILDCDGSINFRGVVYTPVGGGRAAGVPEKPERGQYLGHGTSACPDDDSAVDEQESFRVWSMVGVSVDVAVMAGPGPEPMANRRAE